MKSPLGTSFFVDRRTGPRVSFPAPPKVQSAPTPAKPKPAPPQSPQFPQPPQTLEALAPDIPRRAPPSFHRIEDIKCLIRLYLLVAMLGFPIIFDTSEAKHRPVKALSSVAGLATADPKYNYRINGNLWLYNEKLRMWIDP
jgi:hypothetical protein